MSSILITGAGRGIGAALAAVLEKRGHSLVRGVRQPGSTSSGTEIALDVSDRTSIDRAAAALDGRPLDIVINNAGIFGYRGAGLGNIDDAIWHDVMTTNVMGAYRVAEAFLPHLRAGSERKLVTITSRMGSMGANTTGGEYIYRSSKAAVNAVMRSLAMDLAPEGFIVTLLHPGWVRTEMGGPGAAIDTGTSAAGLADVITGLTSEQSGGFFNYDGTPLVW